MIHTLMRFLILSDFTLNNFKAGTELHEGYLPNKENNVGPQTTLSLLLIARVLPVGCCVENFGGHCHSTSGTSSC